jgi:hypothetical protein
MGLRKVKVKQGIQIEPAAGTLISPAVACGYLPRAPLRSGDLCKNSGHFLSMISVPW